MAQRAASNEGSVATRPATWDRLDLLLAGLVAIGALVVAWVFRTEITPTDPWHYVMAALQFPQGSWVPLGYTRYGMILPLGPLVLALGYVPATFLIPGLLASAVLTTSVFLVATRWWGRLAGFLAVALLLTNWILFTNLSRYYPDIPSMALVLLAVVVALLVRDRQTAQDHNPAWLVLLVGFLLGWSFEARETALFSWPIVVALLWIHGNKRRNAILVAVPVLLWAAADILISALAYGDPLLKLHTFTVQDLSTTKLPGDIAVMNNFVGLPRLDYITMIPRLALESGTPGGIWFLLLGALALLAVMVRNNAVRLCAAALALSYLMFVGVSGLFFPDHPAGRLDVQRYWVQFVPWIALAVAGAAQVVVSRVARSKPRGVQVLSSVTVGVALLAGPAIALVQAVPQSASLAMNGGAPLAQVSAKLASSATAKAAIYTDWQTMRTLPIYRRGFFGGDPSWTAPVRSITGARQPKPGDYVLLVRATSSPCFFCTEALKPWRAAHPVIPPSWQPILTTDGGGYLLYAVT